MRIEITALGRAYIDQRPRACFPPWFTGAKRKSRRAAAPSSLQAA
jgi:hypothetical protein